MQAKRDPDEEGDYMAFEQLMADAAVKKGRDSKDDKKDSKKAKKEKDNVETKHHNPFHSHNKAPEASAAT